MRITARFLLLIIALAMPTACFAATHYVPGVAIVPEIRTANGALRVYETPRGPMYWSPGYPIPHEDSIKLNLFISTGGDKLEIAKVRLDNEEIASLKKTPWSVEIAAAKLGTGYHSLEAWAKCAGKGAKSNSATLVLFIGPAGEKVPTLEEAKTDPKRFALALAGVSGQDEGPTLEADLDSANQSLRAEKPVVLERPITFKVTLPAGKTRFVYSLVRDWKEEFRSALLPGEDRIQLRPTAKDTPGLLPGELLLVIWSADESGQLGQPAVISVSVPTPKEAEKK